LASGVEVNEENSQRILARYGIATDVGTTLPEADFLRQKRRHLQKIAISKHIDRHPGASIALFRLKMWWKDNLSRSDER
jgi:hypothetical protein